MMPISMVSDSNLRQAQHLLHLWNRLSSRHVALGSSCACGAGGVTLVLDDFELDIFGYLQDAAQRSEDSGITSGFATLPANSSNKPLQALLEAAANAQLPRDVSIWALSRIEHTLKSFAELHGMDSGII